MVVKGRPTVPPGSGKAHIAHTRRHARRGGTPGIDLQPEVAAEVGGRVARDGHLAQDLRDVEI
jgi:hypothetical protein